MDSFDFRNRALVKGVISGIPWNIDNQYLSLKVVVIVCMTCMVYGGKKENSTSALLMFDEEYHPTHVKLGYTV